MFGGRIGWPEILIVLVVVVLLFGVGRISKVSEEIGKSIKSFRKGLSGEDEKTDETTEEAPKVDDTGKNS